LRCRADTFINRQTNSYMPAEYMQEERREHDVYTRLTYTVT